MGLQAEAGDRHPEDPGGGTEDRGGGTKLALYPPEIAARIMQLRTGEGATLKHQGKHQGGGAKVVRSSPDTATRMMHLHLG